MRTAMSLLKATEWRPVGCDPFGRKARNIETTTSLAAFWRPKSWRHLVSLCLSTAFIALGCGIFKAQASGIDGNGVGAQSMAMGGADVAWAAGPLGAMGENPAGLGFLTKPQFDLG